MHLLKPLIRSIDHVGDLYDNFSQADKITYNYFLGRKAMFDMDLNLCSFLTIFLILKSILAEKALSYAFENCSVAYLRNKRLILMYLVCILT